MHTAINGQEFWAIKQEIDDITAKLGWSKAYCKKYIQAHYGCHSRLTMTDWQLNDLLITLRDLQAKADTLGLPRTSKHRRR